VAPGLPRINIRCVPVCAHDLVVIARNHGFVYKGESLACFGDTLRVHCLKRPHIPEDDRNAILDRQKGRCATCDELSVLELDHVVPFSVGAPSSLDNLQGLCMVCHKLKSATERHTYGSLWNSQLSRDVLEGLVCAPPPRQLVWGDGREGHELDVVQCRTYALQKADRLPIADVLDRFEVYVADTLYDFVYVDAGACNLDRPEFYCCYAGPRWYSRTLSEWMLNSRVQNGAGECIGPQHFQLMFTASRSITGREVEVVFDRMRAGIDAGLQQSGSYARPYAAKLAKLCLLSMLGRWNVKIRRRWQCCETTSRDDAPLVVHADRLLPSGLTKYMTRHETLHNSTMVLFSLVALNQEQLECCRGIRMARAIGLVIHGTVVDSVLVSGSMAQMQLLQAETERLLRRDGSAILQVKGSRKAPMDPFRERTVVPTVSPWRAFSTCKGVRRGGENFGRWYHDPKFAYEREWSVMTEEEGVGACDESDTFQAHAAERIVENMGGWVEGRGGCGKSRIIELLAEKFAAAGHMVDILCPTHAQSAQFTDGNTILSHLHRFSRSKERVLIIDELSMISLCLFGHLANGLVIGRSFCVVGDPYQIAPIGSDIERWQKLLRSDFLHDLCNGLVVTLRKFRRREAVDGGLGLATSSTTRRSAPYIPWVRARMQPPQ